MNFVDERHALYAGALIGRAMRDGIVVRPIIDNDLNYTDRLYIACLDAEFVVPYPPDDWTL